MKIATWNVNSLKVRLPHVLEWLERVAPDALALQETKVPDDRFPVLELEAAGYRAAYAGQRAYNGVALLCREAPAAVASELPGLASDERRFIAATVGGVRIVNLYVVNGQSVGSERYAYKLEWLARVGQYLREALAAHRHLAVVGDFNIAPEDRDVHDPELWRERILCSTPEREALARLLALGLEDTYRRFDEAPGGFTWWDYRMGAFRRDLGLRIDLVLASHALAERCRSCTVDRAPRALKRPSDHAPVVAEFDL